MDNFLFHRFTAGIGGYDLFLAACGQMWVGITFFGWVWVGVDGCNLFWWVWSFFWLGVSGHEWVWPFLAWCGWVWVVVTFFWLGAGGCGRVYMAYNYPSNSLNPLSDWICISYPIIYSTPQLQLSILHSC